MIPISCERFCSPIIGLLSVATPRERRAGALGSSARTITGEWRRFLSAVASLWLGEPNAVEWVEPLLINEIGRTASLATIFRRLLTVPDDRRRARPAICPPSAASPRAVQQPLDWPRQPHGPARCALATPVPVP